MDAAAPHQDADAAGAAEETLSPVVDDRAAAFARLFEAVHEGVYIGMVHAATTTTLAANPHLKLVLGYPPETFEREVRPFDVGRFADPQARVAFLERLANAGSVSDYLVRLRRADNTLAWIEVTATADPPDSTGAMRIEALVRDVSERKHLEVQSRDLYYQLLQTEKMAALGQTISGVAHELNNPLAVVMGRAGLLEEKLQDAHLRADATRIREAAERCGRIVRTFLNMARSKSPQHRPVQLNELVRAAVDMLGYTFRSHGVEIVLELAPGLPQVQADGDQIGQIVLNLLVNAQQALAAVEPPRRVWITTGVEASRPHRPARVWLRVRDNGPGVPPAARERLFDPFFTTKSEGMGTGLGLSVSRSIAQAHGGDLQLEAPAARGGACFRLSLPLAAPAEPPAPTIGSPLTQEAPALARVLVVDDEPEIAQLMRDMLESAGYEVATAESGAVALELLDMARFDAVVSDLRMPDMDGAALWREVRERQPELARRMLFVTGDTLSPGARQFLDQAGCDSMDKPFARADLLARVGRTLAAGAAIPTAGANAPRY